MIPIDPRRFSQLRNQAQLSSHDENSRELEQVSKCFWTRNSPMPSRAPQLAIELAAQKLVDR